MPTTSSAAKYALNRVAGSKMMIALGGTLVNTRPHMIIAKDRRATIDLLQMIGGQGQTTMASIVEMTHTSTEIVTGLVTDEGETNTEIGEAMRDIITTKTIDLFRLHAEISISEGEVHTPGRHLPEVNLLLESMACLLTLPIKPGLHGLQSALGLAPHLPKMVTIIALVFLLVRQDQDLLPYRCRAHYPEISLSPSWTNRQHSPLGTQNHFNHSTSRPSLQIVFLHAHLQLPSLTMNPSPYPPTSSLPPRCQARRSSLWPNASSQNLNNLKREKPTKEKSRKRTSSTPQRSLL